MFKKLKDKLAEEVKSSPQRIQQFAQAAQAAVTSASSSISDITNNDLFSIGDNDSQQSRAVKSSPSDFKTTFQDVSLGQAASMQTSTDSMDFVSSQDLTENQRQRRLSNSSFASDVSFRLPSYETPSMYHLQSDMEVSASEAEERGFSGGNVSLDRVTKEQIYAAYRRTQERYTKYRTQYADLARHYKLLERENAKARSVLVETQDKALRRISELREQCTLEQSAKAHLEKALRVEIEEKNLKIDTLNTKIKLLQSDCQDQDENRNTAAANENNVQLISFDSESNQTADECSNVNESTETVALNTKIEKLEKLLTKYKDSLKSTKEKCAQLTTETQIFASELESKNKEIEQLKVKVEELQDAKKQIEELNYHNEELQNKVNTFDFNKNKEITTLEIDLQKAQAEIAQLQSKIEVFTKREEEYAISLAENKLSIHKELENKETEIKSLKDRLTESNQEVQSLNIVINDYKNNIASLENDTSKLKIEIHELKSIKSKFMDLESQIEELTQKCQSLENSKTKADEEYKCLQLQLKQETAEKLAMIDRNTYLENRNSQLSEENTKKTSQISSLDSEMQKLKKEKENIAEGDSSQKVKTMEEIEIWKNKCSGLESEIQEERDELVKLQSEIEKLLANHESIQRQNLDLNKQLNDLKNENQILLQQQSDKLNIKKVCNNLLLQINDLKEDISLTAQDTNSLKKCNLSEMTKLKESINEFLRNIPQTDEINRLKAAFEEHKSLHSSARIEIKQISQELQDVSELLKSVKEENSRLKLEINAYELQTREMEENIIKYNEDCEQATEKLRYANADKQELEDKLQLSNVKCQQLQNTIDHNIKEYSILKQEITNMDEKINSLEKHSVMQSTEIKSLNEKLEDSDHKLIKLQEENKSLEEQLEVSNVKSQEHQNIIDQNIKECSTLKQEIASVVEKLNNSEQDRVLQSTKITASKEELEDAIHKFNFLQEENEALRKELKNCERSQEQTVILQQNITELTQENNSLKRQTEGIANNVKELEIELSEVRKSHMEIENEKDHLNSIIEQLESNEKERDRSDKDTQTANTDSKDEEETSVVKVQFNELSQHGPSDNTSIENTDTYRSIIQDNDLLKEENKRLQSDVTGLQTYLAKISKENSELNDKLREFIASSENSPDKNEMLYQNMTELKNEIEMGKEKLNDLIRENTLLVEENLELKDQLNSQNYVNPSALTEDKLKDREYFALKEKYTNVLDANNSLENRMVELENMNKSVTGSMMQMQENNEKLRLSNEKLERRLDEALVSLRHLHSLQENTELEYLRNILYEYLTGTGAHSVTLAKVLAAVVKFDDSQTHMVLQKEKERQGFLRQLGLL